MSQLTTTADFSQMSNAVKSMKDRNIATQSGNVLNIKMNTVSDCLKLVISSSSADSNLTLQYGNAGGDSQCLSLQSAIDANDYSIPLRGQRIKF
jgi:hypothetical protein